jgi:hypothetical protein
VLAFFVDFDRFCRRRQSFGARCYHGDYVAASNIYPLSKGAIGSEALLMTHSSGCFNDASLRKVEFAAFLYPGLDKLERYNLSFDLLDQVSSVEMADWVTFGTPLAGRPVDPSALRVGWEHKAPANCRVIRQRTRVSRRRAQKI